MIHINPLTNRPEPKSQTRTSWGAIHDRALDSRKKVKTNFSYNKVARQPGECRMSAATIQRKAATAAKIARIQKAGEKYRIMAANPESKIGKDGVVFVQNRGEKGKFLPRTILMGV